VDLIHFASQQLQKTFFLTIAGRYQNNAFPLVVRPFYPSYFDEKVSQSDDSNVFHKRIPLLFSLRKKNMMEEL
jgi:hypothetical protein